MLTVWINVGLAAGCRRVTPAAEIVAARGAIRGTPVIEVSDRNWPGWWGPHQDGTTRGQVVPTEWDQKKNVAWVAPVPGRGHSSPCVWNEQVFLTSGEEDIQRQLLLCFNRETGQLRWSRVVHQGGLMKMHRKNSQASATPACDGERVYCAFINDGGLHVSAFDLQGELVWQKEAGGFASEHGYGSSPVLYQSLVIVLGDNLSGSFIAALDRQTGEIVWRKPRHTTGVHASYATPVIAELAGRDQLLVTGMGQVFSYDPASGEPIWYCIGPAEVTACAVACGDELVFASGGFPEKELLAIRADGTGEVTDSKIVWRTGARVTYVPSPLYYERHTFVVSDDGILACLRADDGQQLGQRRLGGNFSASPILAGGLLYVPNESGTTFVVTADPELKIVAQNDLGDGGFASPSICGNQIFLRTQQRLYCISN
jgi:outer membrane protein assembly factor BamB